MADRLIDDNAVIDFIDDNAVSCFLDDFSNYTCVGDQDVTSPTISALAITSTPSVGDTYGVGETIQVRVTFDEYVFVTGTPILTLNIGGVSRSATHDGSSPVYLMFFEYDVVSGDLDTNGISIAANSLSLNGGTIRDGADNNAVLTHTALTDNSSHKVNGGAATTTAIDVGGKRRRTADEELSEAEVQFMQRKLAELRAAKTKREEQAAAKALEVALAQAAQNDEVAEVITATIEIDRPDYGTVMRDLKLLARIIDKLDRMVKAETRENDDWDVLVMVL